MTARSHRRLGRIAAGLLPFSFLVQVTSFVSSIALAHVFGAGTATDAYFVGLSIPVLSYGILLAAVRAGATPALTEVEVGGDGTRFAQVASELVWSTLLIATAVTVIVTAASLVVVPLVLGGSNLTSDVRLTLLELAPLGVFGAVAGALGAVLAVRGSFAPAIAVMAIEPTLKTILTFAAGRSIGVQALIVGNLAGSSLACVGLFVVASRLGVRIRPRGLAVTSSPFIRGILALSGPLVVSQSVLQVNPVVDRTMASDLGAGSVTSLELGLRLFVVPTALLTATLIGPVSATWARRHQEHGWSGLQEGVTGMLDAACWIVPPLMVVSVLLRGPVIRIIYEGGAYTPHAVQETARVFAMLALSMPAQMLTIAFSTIFLVNRQTVFPMKIGVANAVLNVSLNLVLRPFFGVAGIALSTSLTLTILLVAYMVEVQRRWGAFYLGRLWRQLGVVVAATTAAAAAGIVLRDLLAIPQSRLAALAVVAVIAVAVLTAHALVMLLARPGAQTLPATRPGAA